MLLSLFCSGLRGQLTKTSGRDRIPDQSARQAVCIKTDDLNNTAGLQSRIPSDTQELQDIKLPDVVFHKERGNADRPKQGKLVIQMPSATVNSQEELNPILEEPASISADKTTGSYLVMNLTERSIPDDGFIMTTLSAPGDVPADAVITGIQYQIRIIPEGDYTTFYPIDYEIYIKPVDVSLDWLCVYDNLGSINSHYDEGYDDDAANDADIYLNYRSTHAFDGEPAAQTMLVYIADNITAASVPGIGMVDYVYVRVYWEATDPNLSANFTPSGWDAPMIISHSTGSHTNSSTLYAGVPVYITPVFANYTKDIPSSESFYFDLLIDGSVVTYWFREGALASHYYYFADQEYTFAAGSYEICQEVDWDNYIIESNEDDNLYCTTIEVHGPPAPPSLISPANEATCQTAPLWFTWSAAAHTEEYYFEIDDNSDFSSVHAAGLTYETTCGVSDLDPDKIYYWRVRGINPAGDGTWSSVRTFTSAPASAPPAPDLEYPADGATCQPTTIILDGVYVPDAETYNLQVDDNADFSSPLVNLTGLHSNEHEVSGLSPGTTYHWRYASVNSCGMSSGWSAVWEFTTESIPSAPSLSGPSDGATCQSTSLTVSWSSVSGAISYDVVVDDNGDFSSPVEEVHDVSGTSTSITGLSSATTYYWRVRSENSCGNHSGWSSTRELTTSPPSPGIPVASSPANASTCQPLAVTLEWSAASHASTYSLQVDDNSDFSSPLVNETGIGSTSHEVISLSEMTSYHWRIKAENSCGTEGSWSSENSFTTLLTGIEAPVLTGPADAVECQPTSPTLTWNSVANASAYTIEVDDNDDFSSPEYTGSCSGNSHNCSELAENTKFYWRVKASGDCSVASSWSETWNFETGTNGMAAPELAEPVDNSTDQPVSLTLEWDAVADAVSYQFQLDNADDFSSPLYDEIVTGTSHEVSGLEQGVIHFWQIRANGTCATGDWSDTWQFETAGSTPDAISGITDESEGYNLGQNYPNPFMESTTIVFKLPVDGKVNLEFLDMQGKLIETISGYYTAGEHSLEIHLKGKVQSGIYLYRMKTLHFTDTRLCIVR